MLVSLMLLTVPLRILPLPVLLLLQVVLAAAEGARRRSSRVGVIGKLVNGVSAALGWAVERTLDAQRALH
jgi:hypothetical protein